MKTIPLLAALLIALVVPAPAADFKAGLGRVRITPDLPIWLNGYAARTNAASALKTDLWAKALAIEDAQGHRAVIVTTDLIGLPAEVSNAAAARLRNSRGLERAQVLFNSSHTHAGPVVWPALVMFDFNPEEEGQIRRFTEGLQHKLVAVVEEALRNLAPARLAFGRGSASFAMNRRAPAGAGPVDHGVPVLRVSAPEGALRAVLFGYACHNTTLGGDFNQVDGDYAGCAQRELEQAHPGASALFLMLCGGDQNPRPRGRYENVEEHGRALAGAVDEVLRGDLQELSAPIRSAWRTTSLEFAPHSREAFEEELRGAHVFKQRRARKMLAAYDAGTPPRALVYPVQAIGVGTGLTLLGLGGEVVVDYAHRAESEFPGVNLVVAGYCNDVACYIPSLRVLREGGYEAVDSMIYYGQPGPFAETVEASVFRCLRETMDALAADRPAGR